MKRERVRERERDMRGEKSQNKRLFRRGKDTNEKPLLSDWPAFQMMSEL